MIKSFNQFISEMVTSDDMKANLNLGIEKSDAQNPAKQHQQQQNNQQKPAQLKVTDIQGRITELGKQKQIVNQEIINLQDAQRNLMPNNPQDPQNAQKKQVFMKDQQAKMKIQQDKLKNIEAEITNLQQEITRNKEQYL